MDRTRDSAKDMVKGLAKDMVKGRRVIITRLRAILTVGQTVRERASMA